MSTEYSTLRQISLNVPSIKEIRLSKLPTKEEYTEELQQFRENLLRSCAQWPDLLDIVGSPLPILIPEHLTTHLEQLSKALCRAITSIVERWWSDSRANFPEKMPILPHQEAVLRVRTETPLS